MPCCKLLAGLPILPSAPPHFNVLSDSSYFIPLGKSLDLFLGSMRVDCEECLMFIIHKGVEIKVLHNFSYENYLFILNVKSFNFEVTCWDGDIYVKLKDVFVEQW